jgi:ligand-binding sensor domain-containing protein
MVRHELRGHAGDRAVGGLPRWSIGQPASRTPRFLRLPPGQGHSARVQCEFRRPERGRRQRGQGPSGKSRMKDTQSRNRLYRLSAFVITPARPATFTGPNMTRTFKNPVRCTALAVVFLLAVARGELTLAQDGAPDSNFFPIADKSTFLPRQVLVRNMREDRDGNIWFASSAGPIRYDGKTFADFGEEAGIAGRCLFSLTIDKSGALWFGSITGGASKYDGQSFTRFTTKEGLSGNHVSWILEDERGDIWFATDGGVSRYDGKTFTNYSTKDGLPHDSARVIAQDRSGKLWFGTPGGIAFYDGKTFTNFAGIAGREFQNICSIVEDKAGNLWFGGQFGVYRYDGKTGTMLTAKDGLLEDFVGSMIVDKAGRVWFGHPKARLDTQGGATRYDGKAFTHFTQKEGLPSENVYSMFEDREGRIWFGSVAHFGTSRYDGKTFTSFSPK